MAQSKPAIERIKLGRLGKERMYSGYAVLLPDGVVAFVKETLGYGSNYNEEVKPNERSKWRAISLLIFSVESSPADLIDAGARRIKSKTAWNWRGIYITKRRLLAALCAAA
jgi:hypothetical protein